MYIHPWYNELETPFRPSLTPQHARRQLNFEKPTMDKVGTVNILIVDDMPEAREALQRRQARAAP